MEYSSDSEHSDMTIEVEDDAYKSEKDDYPVPLTLTELNDLTRDLNLSKESTQLLGLRLKDKCLLVPGTAFYWYRDRTREFRQFFSFQDKLSLVYCNMTGLIKSKGL